MTFRFFLLGCLAFVLAACAPTPKTPETGDAQFYLREGDRLLENGLHEEAIAAWEKVRESYYSPQLNAIADRKIADALFENEQYLEAAAAYEDFLKQHPNHEETSDILYRLSMSYYNQILSPDRDQTSTRNALATLESLKRLFPGHPRAEEIESSIRHCRNRLAAHELYVGRFYLRSDKPEAAIGRLRGLPALYPKFDRLDAVYYFLGEAYLEGGDPRRAADALASLIREFPESEYLSKAQKLLTTIQ